jgi:hypothetical protein
MAGTVLAVIVLGLLGLVGIWVMIWLLAAFYLRRRARNLFLLPRNYQMREVALSWAADDGRGRREHR